MKTINEIKVGDKLYYHKISHNKPAYSCEAIVTSIKDYLTLDNKKFFIVKCLEPFGDLEILFNDGDPISNGYINLGDNITYNNKNTYNKYNILNTFIFTDYVLSMSMLYSRFYEMSWNYKSNKFLGIGNIENLLQMFEKSIFIEPNQNNNEN